MLYSVPGIQHPQRARQLRGARVGHTAIRGGRILRVRLDLHRAKPLERAEAPISDEALKQLKVAELPPPLVARAMLAARAADVDGCAATMRSAIV